MLLGFLRLSADSAVFPHPLDPETALREVDTCLALEVTRPLGEKEEHWEVLRPLLAASGTAGNLTTDAYLAALAISPAPSSSPSTTTFPAFRGFAGRARSADRTPDSGFPRRDWFPAFGRNLSGLVHDTDLAPDLPEQVDALARRLVRNSIKA